LSRRPTRAGRKTFAWRKHWPGGRAGRFYNEKVGVGPPIACLLQSAKQKCRPR